MKRYFKISLITLTIIFGLNLIFWSFMIPFYGSTKVDEIPKLCLVTDIGLFLIFLCISNLLILGFIYIIKEECYN